jgi:hypothetical protein
MIFRVNPYNRNARKPTITDLYIIDAAPILSADRE